MPPARPVLAATCCEYPEIGMLCSISRRFHHVLPLINENPGNVRTRKPFDIFPPGSHAQSLQYRALLIVGMRRTPLCLDYLRDILNHRGRCIEGSRKIIVEDDYR